METSDKRKLFTALANQKHLLECCRAFGFRLYVVRATVKRSDLLDLKSLVVALCDKSKKMNSTEFEVIETKNKKTKFKR